MAYAYQSIMGQLQPDKKPTDIFAEAPAAQVGEVGKPGEQPGVQKTQAGEAGASASSGETGQAPAAESGAGQSQRAAGRAVAAASKNAWSPVDVTQTTAKMQQASQSLQDEANKYAESEKAKYNYGVTPEALEGAISGKAEDQAKATGLLTRKSIDPAAQFQAQTDTSFGDVDRLGGDLRGLLTQRGGAGYTQQMADFDARALQKNKQFQETLKQLQGQKQDLMTQRSTLEDPTGKLRTDVEAYGTERLTSAQKEAQDYLAKQQASIDAANAEEAAAYNAEIEQLKAALNPSYAAEVQAKMAAGAGKTGVPARSPIGPGGPAAAQDYVGDVRDAMKAGLGKLAGPGSGSAPAQQPGAPRQAAPSGINPLEMAGGLGTLLEDIRAGAKPEMAKYLGMDLGQLGVDANKFISAGGPADASSFMSSDEAARFNSIMGLLGKGGTAAIAGTAGPKATLDKEGLERAIRDAAVGKNEAADAAARAEIDKIRAAATGGLGKVNQQIGNYLDPFQQAIGALSGNIGGLQTGMANYYRDMVDPSKFMRGTMGQASWEDVLSADQAAALNKQYEELGMGQDAKAGRYSVLGPENTGLFDAEGYKQAIYNAMKQRAYNPNMSMGGGGNMNFGNIMSNFDPRIWGPGGMQIGSSDMMGSLGVISG